MRYKLFIIFLLLSFAFLSCHDKNVSSKQSNATKDALLKSAPAQIYFEGDCSEMVLKEICEAKKNIFVKADLTGLPAIAASLIDAHKGGVKVEVITRKIPRNKKDDPVTSMAKAGITVYIDKRAIAREDVLSIDGKTVITGSFDCGKSTGDMDTPMLIVTKSPDFAALYIEKWKDRKEHAKALHAGPAPQKTTYKRKP